jgi:hypothetical protein
MRIHLKDLCVIPTGRLAFAIVAGAALLATNAWRGTVWNRGYPSRSVRHWHDAHVLRPILDPDDALGQSRGKRGIHSQFGWGHAGHIDCIEITCVRPQPRQIVDVYVQMPYSWRDVKRARDKIRSLLPWREELCSGTQVSQSRSSR